MPKSALPIWTQFHVERIQSHGQYPSRDSFPGFPAPHLTIFYFKALGNLGHRDDTLQRRDDTAPVFLFFVQAATIWSFCL